MPKSARPYRSLHALAVAIEVSAMVDPYPKLARLLARNATATDDPYPRLAQVMLHLHAADRAWA
jgi:hypothetical protein